MASVGALRWGRALLAGWGARRGSGGRRDADGWDDDQPLTHSRAFTPFERQFFAAGDGDADLTDQRAPAPVAQPSPPPVPRRASWRRAPLVVAFSGFALVAAGALGLGGGSGGGGRGAARAPAAAVVTSGGARKASVRKAKRRRGAVPRHAARKDVSVTATEKPARSDRSGRQGGAQVIHSPTRR